jgi:hypothetical protein
MKPGFYTYVQTAMSEQEIAKRTKFRMPWEKRQQLSLPGRFFKSTPFDEFGCPLAAAHDGPVTEIHFTVNT